jgi:hypothetical protein
VPFTFTTVVLSKPVPVTVTGVSTAPLAGVIETTFGRTVKLVPLWVVPPAFVTKIGPVIAVAGTEAFSPPVVENVAAEERLAADRDRRPGGAVVGREARDRRPDTEVRERDGGPTGGRDGDLAGDRRVGNVQA